MFKVNNKDTKTTPLASFWCLYCYFGTYFTPYSSVPIVNFEHVITDWVEKHLTPRVTLSYLYPMLHFYTSRKRQKTLYLSDVLRSYINVTLGENGLSRF